MSQKFYTLITQQGAALLANATALGIPLKLCKMAVGDANGSATTPDASQTKLIHEVYKAPLNSLTTDEKNPNQIIAELVIPENQGGWFINEIGLYDEDDTLVAVGNCPITYKPQLSEGSGRTQVIRMIIVVDNVNAVTLKFDPSVVLATRQDVDNLITSKMANHEQTTNHPSATTNSKGFVQLNSSIDSNLENQAATPLAVKKAYNLAVDAAKKAYNLATDAIKKANDLISAHEKSTNHPNATTNSKGFVQLNSAIDSNLENQAATPLAIKKAYNLVTDAIKKTNDLISAHEKSTNHPNATTNSKGFVQLNSAIDSNLENQAATPLAVKKAYNLVTDAIKKTNDLISAHEKSTNHPNATTKSKGFVQLNSSIDSTIENQAATPLAIRKVYDVANGAIKRSGDTMTGQLILSSDVGIKHKYNDSEDLMVLKTFDDNYTHHFYNAKTNQWQNKLIYNSTTNSWCFEYINDVMINGKSVLKAGDAYQNYGLLNNTDLNTLTGTKFGFYGQITDANATSSSNYPIQLAGNLAVYQNYADIGVEGCTQVYYTYSNSRIFIRNYFSRTKTWTKWAEKITTANINNYLPIGIPQPWPCNQPPEGWLECNGSGFNKNQFPKLGAAYPQGFLPDLRGEFIRGWDNARGVDKEREILKWQAPQISAHKHVSALGENRSDLNSSQMQRSAPFGSTGIKGCWYGGASSDYDNSLFYTNNGTNGSINIPAGTTSWNDLNLPGLVGDETRPRNIAFMYIVKAE